MILVACGGGTAAASEPVVAEPRPALLALLDGDWVMVGEVLGEPVKYRLTVQPVAGARFVARPTAPA